MRGCDVIYPDGKANEVHSPRGEFMRPASPEGSIRELALAPFVGPIVSRLVRARVEKKVQSPLLPARQLEVEALWP